MIAQTAVEFKVDGVREQLLNLEQWLARAARQGIGEHEVERHLFREMLALGGQLLGAFLKLVGPGDWGEAVVLGEGRAVKRLPEQHERRLLTVLGEFRLPRWVYGTRPGQKIEWAPTDQRLQLPEGELSYLLQEWEQYLAAGYPIATGVIEGACRHVIKDRMERAGMRWKVPGAQAMLQLRAICANGDWHAFQDARIKHEIARLYPHANGLDHVPWNLNLAL